MTPMDSSVYGSFNFYGQPGVGRGGVTPSMMSLVGSQQVSSTMWRPLGLTSTHFMQTLMAEQSAEIFSLAAEFQTLGANLAKQFQTISSLEVIHQASTQATAYETINMGWMAYNTAFSPHTRADIDATMLEETRQRICTKTDKAQKDTHELVHYDGQLAAFIGDAERNLHKKWGEIWEHICQLTDVEGVSHDACLSLALQVLNKLPIIPIDLTFSTEIPTVMGYCPESCIYQTWHTDQEGTSPLKEKFKASHVLSKKLKWTAHKGETDDSRENALFESLSS